MRECPPDSTVAKAESVTIDFKKFAAGEPQPPIRPRDVFSSLVPQAPGFGYLRDVQAQVLDAWFTRRAEQDVAIKMNTGTGKTTVGLLALRSSINEGVSPGLYVSPDKFLSEQVAKHATELGIPWTEDVESADYLSGRAIGIVNIHKLFNGLSVFGGPDSSRVNPIDIGSLVIDDAHACLTTVEEQTTVHVPVGSEAYEMMFTLFSSAMRAQSPARFADVETALPGAVVRVPIDAWASHIDAARDLLNDYREDDDLKFRWPFLKLVLPTCQAVFSASYLEIKPVHPPISEVSAFASAERRLYLTATLADDSVLVTHFGIDEDAAKSPVTPSTASDIGDRLILSPQEIDPTMTDDSIRGLVSELSRKYSVVVLTPSRRRSEVWTGHNVQVLDKDEISDGVRSLKNGRIGLSIFVNKYDGVDLPNDACRVLVIDGIPENPGNVERRDAELLRGSESLALRQLQKIEQGMGRGVRSSDDYCVVLIVGPAAARLLARPRWRKRLGSATRAQLELSSQVAAEIGPGVENLTEVIYQCLRRDPDWESLSRQCLTGLTYQDPHVEAFAAPSRAAFDAAATGQYGEACNRMSDAINLSGDQLTEGWLMETQATYMQQLDPARAQTILAGAIQRNPRVLRPVAGAAYRRAEKAADQSQQTLIALQADFQNPTDLALGFRDVLDRLEFDPTGHREFENAVEEVGRYIGFGSERPERDIGAGPDCLWAVGGLKFLVIECKSEAQSLVWKKDAGQLAHSMSWFEQEHDSTCSATPVLIHHSGQHESDAFSPPETRLIDAERLGKLKGELEHYSSALASRWPLSVSDINHLLGHHRLTPTQFIDAFTTGL